MRLATLILASVALSIATMAAAADRYAGVIAGFNLADLHIEGESDIEIRSSFAFGGVVDLGLNDHWGIRIEPTFLEKGGKSTHRTYRGTIDGAVFKLDYIDVPILARYDLGVSATRGYLLGGVSVSFATNSEAEVTLNNNVETVDFGEVFNPMDASLDLGGGLGFPVGTNRMTLDGRVAIGLTDINEGGTVTFRGATLTIPSTPTHTLDFRFFASYLFAWPK